LTAGRILTALVMLATALPAGAVSMVEWDARFVAGLAQRGYVDLAVEQGEQMVRRNADAGNTDDLQVELATIYLDIAGGGDHPPEEQRELVAKARKVVAALDKKKPTKPRSIDFRVQLTVLSQRIASALARPLPQLDDAEKDALFDKIDKIFKKVKRDFKQIIKDDEKELDDLYQKDTKNREEEKQIEEKADALLLRAAIIKLREALVYYAHLDTYDSRRDDPDRETLLKETIEKLEHVAWIGQDTSLVCYAYYYLGMIYKKEGDHEEALEAFENAKAVPEDLQVPQITVPMYLEYADTLIRAAKFGEAVEGLNALMAKKTVRGTDDEPRALLYKAKALFGWSFNVKDKTPQRVDKIKQLYNAAVEVCDRVIKKSPQLQGAANSFISEWTNRIYPDTDFRNPAILRPKALDAYRAKNYAEAASLFRKLVAITTERESDRVQDGWRLVMCYYHLERYYEALAAADLLTLRFDPDSYTYANRALHVAIKGMQVLSNKTGDPFDKALYVDSRKRLGEEKFKLFDAHHRMKEGNYDLALSLLATIRPGSDGYDTALFTIAECKDLQSDEHFRLKKYRECIENQAEAVKSYAALLDWTAAHPLQPDDRAAAARRDIEARAMFKLGRLLTGTKRASIEGYYKAAAKRARTAGRMAAVMNKAASALLQPAPEKLPATRAEAAAMLEKLGDAAGRLFLELTSNVAETHSDAVVALPYIHYLRITAAVRLNDMASAQDDLSRIEKYAEFGGKIRKGGVYGRVAAGFDSLAGQLEKQNKPEEAQKAFGKAVSCYLKMFDADPEQSLEMYHYAAMLMQKQPAGVAVGPRLKFIVDCLKRFEGATPEKEGAEDKMDQIKLIHAELLFEKGNLADSVNVYTELDRKLDRDHQTRKAKDATAKTKPHQWQAKLGLANAMMALGKYDGAAVVFHTIRKKVPKGGEAWWKATYDLANCLIELKLYDNALTMIQSVHAIRPGLGGEAMRNEFLKLLGRIMQDHPSDKVRDLIDKIQNYNKEQQ